jgi:UDP-N-acetylmuramoylalanine--D-glutamate ligase
MGTATGPDTHRALAGRRVLVMGLGSFGGGAGASRYLAELGARVLVTDRRDAGALAPTLRSLADLDLELVLGQHREADFERAELVVVNPAVPPGSPFLARARAAGARLTSEIELFLEACPARVAAVTGTQGKSSTTHFLHALLRACGLRSHRGGNIGGSLLAELPRIEAGDVVVLELSSYQLEALPTGALSGRVEAAAIVNVLPDHLERHGTLEVYRQMKARLLELTGPRSLVVLPAADPALASLPVPGRKVLVHEGPAEEGLFVSDGRFRLDQEVLGTVDDLHVPGAFQRTNALVALGLARHLGATPGALASSIGTLQGLEHRLQDLGTVRGRRVVDNAVSTTPDSTISALRSLPPGVLLLVGGRRKALALDELCAVARERQARPLCFGEAAADLVTAFERAGVIAERHGAMAAAIQRAFDPGFPGELVLFSPACSSFDAFGNFQERAHAFRSVLEDLA